MNPDRVAKEHVADYLGSVTTLHSAEVVPDPVVPCMRAVKLKDGRTFLVDVAEPNPADAVEQVEFKAWPPPSDGVRALRWSAIGALPSILVAAVVAVPVPVGAQSDVIVPPIAGVYEIIAAWPPEPDALEICCYRVDVDPEDPLGCSQVHFPFEDTGGVIRDATKITAIVAPTPGDDAEVRCRASDSSGNISIDSPNAAILDFTPPSPPVIRGDLDADGDVDVADSVLLRRQLAGLS